MSGTENLKILDGFCYPAVGKCIYCGETKELSKEHILPFGLNGSATLPAASCTNCSKITGGFELAVLRGQMQAVRVYRGLRSRKKHLHAPRSYPLTIIKQGKEIEIELALEDYPVFVHFPVLGVPGFYQPEKYTKGVLLSGFATLSFGPNPKEVLKKLEATDFRFAVINHPVAFARMIAKIAYAYAYAEGKLDLLKGTAFVLPAILGNTDDVGRWVGCTAIAERFEAQYLHTIAFHEDIENNLLLCSVRLFADSQAPSYVVVLGKMK